MEKLYNLARGTVRLEISGAEPERLLNFCAEKGIEFWDTSPKTEFCVCITVHAADYPAIQEQNGKNGCEIRLINTRGGKNITRAMRRRYAFCIGLGFCIVMLALSSMFVWKIDIIGNDNISDCAILRTLQECGVEYGTFWPAISSDDIRNDFLMLQPDIAWMSVNVHNSCAQIIVHERIEKPDIVDETEHMDISAAKSGIITKLSVLEGKPMVAVGDTVLRGETIISGTMDSETADNRYVHAMGTAEARTWYEISAQTPLYETVKADKKHSKTKYSLVIGKNRINFLTDSRNDSSSCDKINKLEYASLGRAFVLPVGIIKERCVEYETKVRQIDIAAAEERLKQTLIAELERQINGGSVSQTNFSVSKDDKMLTVTLRAECIENIGVQDDRENNRS